MLLKSVYIQGPGGAPYETMFAILGISRAKDIESSDFVCFTGGEDVDPDLYGEKPLRATHFNDLRDTFDTQAYARAKTVFKGEEPKPCVGICRGGQFLNVMNGGRLWQDVDRHTNSHTLWDPHIQREFFVTSTHHQQMIPHSSGVLVAYSGICKNKTAFGRHWSSSIGNTGVRGREPYIKGIQVLDTKESIDPAVDAEVVWYPETQDLCFQPHPEFRLAEECRHYFFDVFNRYLLQLEGAA